MSEVTDKESYPTQLKDETFLRFVDNSTMGVLIIQRGFLKYFNKQFAEIFGYTKEDILNWKKREFYNIVHPDDQPHLLKNFKIQDDNKTIAIHFRGVRKDKSIIPIENYNCQIRYDNKFAVLSSYIQLDKNIDELYHPTAIEILKEKKIVTNYTPKLVEILKEKNIEFEIINQWRYKEEK